MPAPATTRALLVTAAFALLAACSGAPPSGAGQNSDASQGSAGEQGSAASAAAGQAGAGRDGAAHAGAGQGGAGRGSAGEDAAGEGGTGQAGAGPMDASPGGADGGSAGQSGSGPLGGAPALESLRDALMQAACAQAVACHRFETVDDCALILDLTDFEYLVNAAIAGRSTYHPDGAATCLAHYGDAFCRVEPGREDPCAGLFEGTLAAGAACRVTAECALGLECVIDFSNCMSGCCQGTCMSFRRVELGGSCAEPASRCAPGSFCSTATSEPTCVPQLGAGSPCAAAGQCSPELLCQLSPSGSGVCRVLPEPGARCDPADGLCVDNDTYCDPVSSTCATRKSPGASCTADVRSECNGYSVCVDGQCQSIPAPGETCTEALGCLHGEGCIVGHCYARPHEVCPPPI